MKKKRNPNDATLRNIRALKRRVDLLDGKLMAVLIILRLSASAFSERINLGIAKPNKKFRKAIAPRGKK